MTKFKRFTALLMTIVLCVSLFAFVACVDPNPNPDPGTDPGTNPGTGENPETRPLTMSIQNPDGLFNPFFSTSAMDSSIIGMTQIGMLTSTKDGQPKWGDDEPVAVKDCKIEQTDDGKYTDYTFIIKNGIKFSDGQPLTIKDILFNLYVYLDPVYTGSSTIYSTDIVGLQAYRQQDPDASAEDASAAEDRFIRNAAQRITELVDFVRAFGIYNPPVGGAQPPDPESYTDADILSFWESIVFAGKNFRKELETDWNNASVETYKDEGFTEKWQVFLAQDGGIDFYQKDAAGKYIKDPVTGNRKVDTEIIAQQKAELDEYLEFYNLEGTDDDIRNWAINAVYEVYFPIAINTEKGEYVETVFDTEDIATIKNLLSDITANRFSSVVTSWVTANDLLSKIIADLKSEQFGEGDHPIKTITGITSSAYELEKVTKDFSGNNLGEPHDVLNIRINNIDPKAIWNFSFNIAPMHYYSGTFEGVNYITSFDAKEGNFGFKFSSKKFFDEVINASDKVGLPVGAGVYMASTVNGGVAKNGSEFKSDNIVYYERNPYFYTLFGDDTSKNAKIKYFRYKIVESDQILNAIGNKDIDIGDPSATPENIDWLNSRGIEHEEVMTSGYGYVGINPRFIPDVAVRRAIIKAMNRALIKDNYYQDLCEIINRPMSMANWAFPDGATVYSTTYTDKNGQSQTVSYEYDRTGIEIEKLLESAGYEKRNNIYHKVLADGSDHELRYKFTIAGSSTDHPAYAMFITAQNLLNDHGFDVKVVTAQSALSDLSAGKLAVWAAAWSSTIDPDMYQVYHKDSSASSVNNWGYPQIKANPRLYSFEQGIMEDLSLLIEQGRETNDESERKDIYSDALDLVMEFAVELPTYQRFDLTAFNGKILDRDTMTPKTELSPYNGLISRIWELNYIQ